MAALLLSIVRHALTFAIVLHEVTSCLVASWHVFIILILTLTFQSCSNSMGSLINCTLRTQSRAVVLTSRARLIVGAPTSARLLKFGLICIAPRRDQNTPLARALSSSQVLSAEDVGPERKEIAASPPSKTIYVGNLHKSMKHPTMIERHFSTFGPIVSIRKGESLTLLSSRFSLRMDGLYRYVPR